MIAFDSNIVIYAMTGRGEFAQPSRQVLLNATRQGGIASVLLLREVLCKTDPELQHQALQTKHYLVNIRQLSYIPVSLEIAEKAAELIRSHGKALRLTDAIHLQTAHLSGAAEFWTNDKKLAQVQLPGLSICLLKPANTTQQ